MYISILIGGKIDIDHLIESVNTIAQIIKKGLQANKCMKGQLPAGRLGGLLLPAICLYRTSYHTVGHARNTPSQYIYLSACK
jgi:hypothetical protein